MKERKTASEASLSIPPVSPCSQRVEAVADRGAGVAAWRRARCLASTPRSRAQRLRSCRAPSLQAAPRGCPPGSRCPARTSKPTPAAIATIASEDERGPDAARHPCRCSQVDQRRDDRGDDPRRDHRHHDRLGQRQQPDEPDQGRARRRPAARQAKPRSRSHCGACEDAAELTRLDLDLFGRYVHRTELCVGAGPTRSSRVTYVGHATVLHRARRRPPAHRPGAALAARPAAPPRRPRRRRTSRRTSTRS